MRQLLRIKHINHDIILYIFSAVSMLLSFILGVKNQQIWSLIFMSGSFIVSFFACFFVNNKQKYLKIIPIYLGLAIFWNLSFYYCFRQIDLRHKLNAIIGIISLNVPIIVAIIKNIHNNITPVLKTRWKKYLICLGISLVYVLLSLDTLTTITRLDSNIYYNALSDATNWDMSFDSVRELFLGGHTCIGYTLFGMIGAYITPNSALGIRLINIVLVVISIFAFYSMLEMFIESKTQCGLLTSLFAFNPLILGIIYEINLDLPQTCFYIWTLYFAIKRDYLYMITSSILLLYSKETGIILLFGIYFGYLIYDIIKIFKEKNIKNLEWKFYIIGIFLGGLGILNKLMGVLWRQDSLEASSSLSGQKTMDSFTLNRANIFTKTKELFLVNFAWIVIAVIIVCLLINIVKRKGKTEYKNFLPILCSFLFFVAFQYVYITYIHIRYIMPYIVGLIVIFGILLNTTFSKWIIGIMESIIVVLSLIQCFYTLDPVTRGVFPNINIGGTEIITTRTFRRGINNEAWLRQDDEAKMACLDMTQSAIYNRQYMYFQFAFEEALKTVQYDNNTLIIISPTYEELPGMTWICLFGQWYTDKLYYDPCTYRLSENKELPSLKMAIYDDNILLDLNGYERVFYFDMPYNNLNNDYMYNISYIKSYKVEKKDWIINIYEVK